MNTSRSDQTRREPRQEFPGHDRGAPSEIVDAPGEPEGTGDRLEREPNQRPDDLDLHQVGDGGAVKGQDSGGERHPQA